MQLAADNAMKQVNTLEKITTNISNMNTVGYKTNRFETYLRPDGTLDGVERTDTSKGNIMLTNRPLDVAIDGFGYMPVTQPDGTVAYTRDGSLALNSEGFLVTNRGDLVGTGFQIPGNYKSINIGKDGTIKINVEEGDDGQLIGKLNLVRFANPEGLKSIGNNKLVVTSESGEAVLDNDSKLKQGNLERANVNMFHQIDSVLRLNASMFTNIKMMKLYDDLFRQSVNLRQ